jgi:hypothetical protein
MKKVALSLTILTIVMMFCFVGSASADTISYSYTNDKDYYVNSDLNYPTNDQWFKLLFPGPNPQYYSHAAFEYGDYYPNDIDAFNITINGDSDNSNAPIDIWLSFYGLGNHQDKVKIAEFNPEGPGAFTLTLDLLANKMLYSYNGRSLQDLGAIDYDISNFVGKDKFYIGYACHFWHRSTAVDLSVSNAAPVPEPTTLLLFGSGICGLAITMRRKK